MRFKQVIATVIISVLVSWASFAVLSKQKPETKVTEKKQESVYDRVMRTKTIQCGYFVRPPILAKDPNTGELSGIVYDLMQQIGEKLSLKIEWREEVAPADLIPALEADRFDMSCAPGWINSQRARVIAYSNPVFFERSMIFTQADNLAFDADPKILNDAKYKMSIIDGSTPAYLTRVNFPQANIVALPEGSQAIQVLMETGARKSDAALFAELEGYMYMQKNPGQLRIVPNSSFGTFPSAFIFKRNEVEFQQMLNSVLIDLQAQGILDKTIAKHEPTPGFFLRPAAGYQQ